MRALIYLVLTVFALNTQAATLECKSFINLDEVTSSAVVTSLKNKVLIDKVDEITSYVTETSPNVFSLEAFIPSLEMRIYSEAALNNVGEVLKATAWAREILVDVICKRIK
ncbi:MAG: hypothetical protein ABL930_09365 [Pseudobdellovibrio sp.]